MNPMTITGITASKIGNRNEWKFASSGGFSRIARVTDLNSHTDSIAIAMTKKPSTTRAGEPPAKPVRKRNKLQTEKTILVAAEKLFSRYGFDTVSTKQLATEAGVAIGALYHHFPSKEAVYAAAAKRAFARHAELPAELTDSNTPSERRLVHIVTWFIRALLEDKTFGALLQREMLDPRPSTSHLLDADLFQNQLNLFKELINELAPACDTEEAVAALLALLFGFANLKGVYALFPGVQKKLETPEEIAEYATGLLLNGLPR